MVFNLLDWVTASRGTRLIWVPLSFQKLKMLNFQWLNAELVMVLSLIWRLLFNIESIQMISLRSILVMELSKKKSLTELSLISFQIPPHFSPVTISSPRDLKFKWKWRQIFNWKSLLILGMKSSFSNSDLFLFLMPTRMKFKTLKLKVKIFTPQQLNSLEKWSNLLPKLRLLDLL